MKKLIVCTAKDGHKELTVQADIKEEFEKIMTAGYGGNVPAVFHVTHKKGEDKVYKGEEARGLIEDPNVLEVTVVPMLAGG